MKTDGLSKLQIIVMAVTAGVCVANIYYNQPILKEIAASFATGEGEAGNISVLAQAGYGLGLFFLTPLGDKTNRKKLILILQSILVVALLGMALITNLTGLFALSLVIGMLAVAAQVILPMAASLDKVNRGRTVGIIITGVLVGILAARVISGFITEWFGWRFVYGISAGMVLITALLCHLTLPDLPPQFTGNYKALLQSTLSQVRRFVLLRRTALLGALVFGAFCSFWTTLTFHLSGSPFYYRSDVIGLFGILAIGGALLAPVFGKLADKGNPGRSQLFAISLLIAGVILIKLFPYNIVSFVVAVLLLDIGVQATQVTNVATIYTLDDTAHSRINTVYMTSYFLGGSIGTFAGVQCWKLGGWPLVTWQLLTWSLLALLVAYLGYRKQPLAKSVVLQSTP
ncbi:MFS transporter [Segetibacter sp. 3557_3]|uniref:MFS transporter n=1 Tax=Segetibacter sp. 3557_3 TaxID=2547429 RepID=UPI00105883E4|nr:MFS transporter [Segetibacter sp. 3557_3]TDH21247.1 MFS transporter [Segetibacter sp. 3557_3]